MWGHKRNSWGETPQQEIMRRLEAVEALAQECAERDNKDDSRWSLHEYELRTIRRTQLGLPPLEDIEPPPDQEPIPDIFKSDA